MKKHFSQEILIIAILTLTITSLWVYLSIYKTLKDNNEKPLLTPQETKLLNPKLDSSVFDELKKRGQ